LDPGALRAVAHEAAVGTSAEDEPERIDQQALAGAGLAGDDVQTRAELEAQPVDEREVRDAELEEPARPLARRRPYHFLVQGRPGARHDGRSSTLWRSRSQNGWAPLGSRRRIGRSIARTSTTSPTSSRRSSRPSMLTRASCASTTRQ